MRQISSMTSIVWSMRNINTGIKEQFNFLSDFNRVWQHTLDKEMANCVKKWYISITIWYTRNINLNKRAVQLFFWLQIEVNWVLQHTFGEGELKYKGSGKQMLQEFNFYRRGINVKPLDLSPGPTPYCALMPDFLQLWSIPTSLSWPV